MKSPLATLAALALIALVAIGSPASAQTREDAQVALDRTDDLIARAQEVVSTADNAQAEAELAFAVQLQAQAKAAFGAGSYRLALDLTFRARLRADRAVALVRGLPDPDRVLAQ